MALPVDFASINKSKVTFEDKSGNQRVDFENKSDARQFLSWLTSQK
ncbi:hypothetical protein PSPO_a0623 [Pseudoalteromonas spongiae UST010723-006]|nr:hypothetical protein PSPO_a0623 [Pseudoalteromonas spongiae UST010723-006]